MELKKKKKSRQTLVLEATWKKSRYIPEHVTQAFQDTFLGFVLVLVPFFVLLPFRVLLLFLPACLVSIFQSVIFRKVAVHPGTCDEVATGGH